MPYTFSTKSIWIIIVIGALLLWAPPLMHILSFFKGANITALRNILEQPYELKMAIKNMAGFGILLCISFFAYVYTCVAYLQATKRKKAIFGVIILHLIGAVGYFLGAQTRIIFREGERFLTLNPDTFYFKKEDRIPIVDNANKHNVMIQIKFKSFADDFRKDLEMAMAGKIKMGIMQRVSRLPQEDITVTLDQAPLKASTVSYLTPQQLQTFLATKELKLTIKGRDIRLVARDLKGGPLTTRDDALYVDDVKKPLAYDQAFLVFFYVEDLKGNVQRVYL